MGRRAEAREVLRLFELPDVRDRGVSPEVAARAGRVHGRHGGGAPRRADRTAAHSTRSSQISHQYG